MMFEKIKEKIKSAWNWTKHQYKKILVIIGIGIALAADIALTPPKLECLKENILYSQEFTDTKYNDKREIISQQQIVSYACKSGELAPPLENEIIEQRTENIVTRNLGGNERSAQSGYNFYKEGNDWKQVKFATTTKEVFDKVTLSFIEKVFAADTGATSPGTMADDTTVGDVVWSNPNNAKVSDDADANAPIPSEVGTYNEYSIKIVRSGTISGTEKSTSADLPVSDTYITYGGATDKWGLTWTAEIINATDFGVVYSAYGDLGTSHYLKATNFGFAITAGSTIDGIKVEIEQAQSAYTGAFVDHIRITVYYTEGAAAAAPTQRRFFLTQ